MARSAVARSIEGPRRSFLIAKQGGAAGWLFLAPALTLILIFFFLPVAAAFVMSFTDFDIYALGSLD